MKEPQLTLAQFQNATDYQNDPEFRKFVESVTPKGRVQQVLLGEILLILQLLWKIYEFGKALGWWDRFLLRWQTRRAMHRPTQYQQEVDLTEVAGRWEFFAK